MVTPTLILAIYITARIVQFFAERYLATINRGYYSDPAHQAEAQKVLGISPEEMAKAYQYSTDKFNFGQISSALQLVVFLGFLVAGGPGLIENAALALAGAIGYGGEPIAVGLAFFALLGLLSMVASLPYEYYFNFVLEEKHGFNKQSVATFFGDKLKGIAVGALLGGPLLALVLYLIESAGPYWWLYAWLVVFGFSLLMAYVYPEFLAPLFNSFRKIEDGELKTKIFALAKKVSFDASEISIMDASKRTSHGNAYFTGVFGQKKIVLFDTLVESMSIPQIIAVMAHELGHFKLNHIRWNLVRGFIMTGITFFLLSLCLPYAPFYEAFFLKGVSAYGALVVFSILFGPIGFLFQPLTNLFSQKYEFEADAFALEHIDNKAELSEALLKLREKSQVMPISHPLFSKVYLSHPPLMERLKAMGYY